MTQREISPYGKFYFMTLVVSSSTSSAKWAITSQHCWIFWSCNSQQQILLKHNKTTHTLTLYPLHIWLLNEIIAMEKKPQHCFDYPKSSWRGNAGWAERLRLSDFWFFPAADDCQYCLESILREVCNSWILHADLLPLTEEMRWKERNNS